MLLTTLADRTAYKHLSVHLEVKSVCNLNSGSFAYFLLVAELSLIMNTIFMQRKMLKKIQYLVFALSV